MNKRTSQQINGSIQLSLESIWALKVQFFYPLQQHNIILDTKGTWQSSQARLGNSKTTTGSLHSPLQKWQGEWCKLSAQRFLGSFGWTSVSYDWLMLAFHRPIITNACQPKRSSKARTHASPFIVLEWGIASVVFLSEVAMWLPPAYASQLQGSHQHSVLFYNLIWSANVGHNSCQLEDKGLTLRNSHLLFTKLTATSQLLRLTLHTNKTAFYFSWKSRTFREKK